MIGYPGLVAFAGFGVALMLFALWRVQYARAVSQESELLADGAVLVVSEGRVQQASPLAGAVLGDCTGQTIGQVLSRFLGSESGAALEAVDRLVATGEPVDLLVRSRAGAAFELIGAPAGALIRVVLRDARYLDERLREAEARVRAAEDAMRVSSWETDALHALVAEGPIIAWRRTASGEIDRSAGRISTSAGAVTPEQAVDLIMARTRLNRQTPTPGEPHKSRIEIMVGEGAETIALHVVEMVRQDGSRIGFATDAGAAAAAERTLARFVQTMTETFAHLTVGLAIFDRNQTLALFNPALVRMWQVEPAWLARRPSLREILDELRAIRRLPELENFHEWRARLLGLFENTEAADYEELWHLADGSNIRVLARPHPHGALAFTFDDVSERMRLEQRYRRSVDLRRASLDGLAEGIAVFGSNGLLQFVNQAFHEIWGADPDMVYAAMHARQLIDLCEDMAGQPETWQKLYGFITGEEGRRAWAARFETNAGRIVTARFAPLPDGSTLAVFIDITTSERIAGALHEHEAALEIAETGRAALRDLAAGAAAPALDEIETRLAEIRAAAPLPDKAQRAAAAIESAVPSLRSVLTGAAEIATLPALAGEDNRTDLHESLRAAAGMLRPSAAEAGVALLAEQAAAPARVPMPAGQLGRIALQLATDALARSAPGSAVKLSGEQTGAGFALHADCTHCRSSDPAEDAGGRLAYLAARQGGRVARRGEPGGPARLSCLFETSPPAGPHDAPSGAEAETAGGGAVQEPLPRAS